MKNGDIRAEYLRTEEMIADMLTKSIQKQIIKYLRDKLMGAKLCAGSDVKLLRSTDFKSRTAQTIRESVEILVNHHFA